MNIQFATCERRRALRFIQAVYPGYTIADTPESVGEILDLVEQDIIRVQDPMMHGETIQIVPGTHWDESKREDVYTVCSRVMTHIHETAKNVDPSGEQEESK